MPRTLALLLAAALLGTACSSSGAPTTTAPPAGPPPTARPPPTSALPTAPPAPVPDTSSTTVAAPDPCQPMSSAFTGAVFDRALTEISGIVASRSQPGVLWVHNDSGSDPVVYAVAPDGTLLGSHRLSGADGVDWEDIAIGPGPEGDHLYVGDIGDNAGQRDHIVVYRAAEPLEAATGPRPVRLDRVDAFSLRYPGEPYDAEALLVDPASGDLFVVTKDVFGSSLVYRAAAPLADGAVLEEVAALELGIGGLATAGDISPAGDLVALRTYTAIFLWRRASGEDIASAFRREPCVLPLLNEGQGEALGFAPDGEALYTIPEGAGATLQRHELGR